ncbi:hypothetical protein [Aquirufa rosea]|uniref:50S ribosomal protein L5 n=1 Tax=Aquirufa rosea TaxID=2509241 RepID=A0A4V1M559_9BACT|nr:hypothetical protein [Aquirufa rosea]RXK46535.1 hypothetical protein ESB04_11975 [Aquirufa rosea]
MKKLVLLLVLIFISEFIWAQAKTSNFIYYKIKPGQRSAFNEALKSHVAKFRKSNTPYAWSVFNLVGGSHHNEVMALSNIGLSWAERDELGNIPTNTEAANDFYLRVSPFIAEVTGGEIITYHAEYSNANFGDRTNKVRSNILTLRYVPAQEFWDVIKKLPKAWDKAGIKVATYQTSGLNRLIFSRRFPNGWKELDEAPKLKNAYDEVYGKGAYEKDIAIMRNYVVENETVYMTLQPDLSSK